MEPGNNSGDTSTGGTSQSSSIIDTVSSSDALIERKVPELMERAAFEKRTKEIITNYIDSVSFMKKVQEYASEEVKRCYSTDRYQDFQKGVQDIIYAELAGDTARDKLDTFVVNKVSKVLDDRGWKKKNFWWPVGIAIGGVIVGAAGVVVAVIALHRPVH